SERPSDYHRCPPSNPATQPPSNSQAGCRMSRKLTYDTYLFGSAMLIVVIGMVMIYSASAIITTQKVGSDNPYYFITRQGIWLFAGSLLVFALMHVDLTRLRQPRAIYTAMGLTFAALVIVLF